MDTSSQEIQDIADVISQYTKQSCFSNSTIIAEVLLLLSRQKPEYSEFSFKGKGGQALVLKAIKVGCTKPVALKIREFDEKDKKEIQHIQREQNLLKMFTFCKYIMQVNTSFYLTKKKKSKDAEAYFVEEMELCDEDLSRYLLEFKKKAKQIDNDTKILMVIQMLDAINTLHQRNVMHRDIKPQNFLVSDKDQPLPTLKLSDLSFSSPLNVLNSISFLSAKGTHGYLSPEAADNQSRLQSDLYSFGVIMIEIDNTFSFDFGTVKETELALLFQGNVFEKHNINRTSILYKLAFTFLQPQYQNRSTASQALFTLLKLLKHANNLQKIQLFSVITLDLLSSESKFLPTKSEYQACIKVLESQKNSDQSVQEEINILIQKYKASYFCSFHIEDEQILFILRKLLSSGEFQNCEYLGVGATGLAFGIYNIKYNRHSALKLCMCKNERDKAEKIAEAGLKRQCQMPNIVKFFGHQYFEDDKGTTFVIEEYERCRCTLSSFLEKLKKEGTVISDKQKMSMAHQMINSVNYLHEHSILHRDIKLDNYLITAFDGEHIEVKLSDFDQSAQIDEYWFDEDEKEELTGQEIIPPYNCLINSAKKGSHPFYAPERHLNPSKTTKQTDSFSVGLCVAILDNYRTFTEEYLCIRHFHYFKEYFNDPFEGCQEKINKESALFPLIVSLLEYSPTKRGLLGSVISKTNEFSSKQSIPSLLSFNLQVLSLPHPNHLVINNQQYPVFLEQISIFTSLITLNLNLYNSKLGDTGTEYISNALKTLSNLSTLNLNLWNNNLSFVGAEYLSNALKTLTNLVTLNLNLEDNNLSDPGVEHLSRALKTLTNLSTLNLNLYYNNLSDVGAEYLSNGLKTLTNLTALNLNFYYNKLSDTGAGYISNGLKPLTNLSALNLNLWNNNLSSAGAYFLSDALKKLTNLSTLNLNFGQNNLRADGAYYLSIALKALSNLSTLNLNLYKNNISDDGAGYISNSLQTLTNLPILNLNLWNNNLSDSGAKFISGALKTLTNLSILNLNLRYINLNNIGAEYLSNALKTLTNLSTLNLIFTYLNLSAEGAEYLSDSLRTLSNLQTLNLNFNSNNLRDAGAEYLSNGLKTLTNLSTLSLNLRKNYLSDAGAKYLSNALKTLTNLSTLNLNLDDNNLIHIGAEYLSNALKIFTNLSTFILNIYKNNLSDAGAKHLSNALKTLTNLSTLNLNLYKNNLTDSGAEYLSNVLKTLTNLSTLNLNLYKNNISVAGVEKIQNVLKTLTNLKHSSFDK